MTRLPVHLFRWCLFAIFACQACMPARANEQHSPWSTRVWRPADGLPDNTVVGIAQTSDGFLWVATQNALARFDGVRFRAVEVAGTPDLQVGENTGLAVDQQDRLWLMKTRGAVVCLDGGQTFAFRRQPGMSGTPATDVAIDGQNNLWLATAGHNVVRIQNAAVQAFSSAEGLPSGGRCWLTTDRDGDLWFSTGKSIGVFRGGKFVSLFEQTGKPLRIAGARSGGVWILAGRQLMKFTEGSPPTMLGSLPVTAEPLTVSTLYEDHSEALWIGLRDVGLFRYDAEGFTHVVTSHHDILCVTEDRENNLWVGTSGGGLNRIQPRRLMLHNVTGSQPIEHVLSACVDANGDLWCVTRGGAVVRRQGGTWTTIFRSGEASPVRYATCIAPDPQGGVWIGTHYNGLRHLRNEEVIGNFGVQQGLASPHVRALLVTPSGEVWLGTDGLWEKQVALQQLSGKVQQTFNLPLGSEPVIALAQDATGDIWAGTADGHLLRVKKDALVDETSHTLSEPKGITSLCTTPDQSLWIGYAGAGLGYLKGERFKHFTTEQGLYDDYIAQVLPDEHGRLWCAASRGLFHVDLEQFEKVEAGRGSRVRSVVLDSGQASQGYWPSAARTKDGHLWFPMLSGLLETNPTRSPAEPKPPPVVIEQATIDGQQVSLHNHEELLKASPNVSLLDPNQKETHLRLPANNQRMTIEFTALSFEAPENVAFRYRLEGLDQDWVDAGNERAAYFTHLSPGEYRFYVIACNQDGVWNETGASLGITVLTPFWQTGWFLTLTSLTALGCGGAMIRHLAVRRVRRKLEKLQREHALELERSRIAKDIHDDLGANLTEITLLSELAQDHDAPPEEVAKDLQQIGTKARQLTDNIANIVWAVNPQHDALDNFITYACTHAEDYLRLAHIHCRLDIPRNVPTIPLAAPVRHNLFLTLKEALNNIVKHASASEVALRFTITPKSLRLGVADNGCGFDPRSVQEVPEKDHRGYGLFNMRQRMEGVGGTFHLQSQPGEGTRIELELNLK